MVDAVSPFNVAPRVQQNQNVQTNQQQDPIVNYSNTNNTDTVEISSKKTTGEKAVIATVATLGVTGLALGIDALLFKGKGRKAILKIFKGEVDDVVNKRKNLADDVNINKVSDDVADKMNLEELVRASQTDISDPNKKINILGAIFKKSEGEAKINAGRSYIRYLDGIENSKINLNNEINIKREKICTYVDMAHSFKGSKNYDEALNMMEKALALRNSGSIAAEVAKIKALMGKYDEGLDLITPYLEKIQRRSFGDDQATLFEAISECVKYKNPDLAKSIDLLKLGSYNFEKLTVNDTLFLTGKNINYVKLTGNGSREQTGALAKWVLEQLAKKSFY